MSNETVTLSVPLVNALLNYLSTRPFAEVYQLIQEVQKQSSAQAAEPKQENVN